MAIRNNVAVTTAETAVEFDARYPFMWVRNLGDTDCYASVASGFDVSGADVALVKAGDAVRVFVPDAVDTKSVYIKTASGSTTVDVHAENESTCPFKLQAKGGEQIDVTALNVNTNGTYTASSGKAYSPVTVNVHDDKYDLLYGNWYGYTAGPSSIDTKRLVKPITEYDDIIIWTSFLFQGHEWTNFVRCPASEIAGKNYNVVAYGGNYVTGSISADGTEITDTGREFQAIVAVYGIEVNNMERTTIFENTGSTNPATYSLPTGKTFSDYDEFIIIGEKDNFVYASYVPTSEIYVNNIYFGISIGSVGKTMYFSDNSTITDDTAQTILVKKIIGVKYTTSE